MRQKLHRVTARRRPPRIDQRRRCDQKPCDIIGVSPVIDVPPRLHEVLEPSRIARRHRRARPPRRLEHRGRGGGEIGREERHAHVERLDPVTERLAPGLRRRHVDQVLHVDRGDDALPPPEHAPVLRADADAAALLEQ